MTTQAINIVTAAAIKLWQDSESPLSYADFIKAAKATGRFWGAKESL